MAITDIIRSIEFVKANYNDISNEIKNLLEVGVAEYLQSQSGKYYYTNTFLHRDKVCFDEIYYPLKATYKEYSTDFKDLNNAFGEYQNITLVGMAGQGKTTLLKYIFLNAVRTPYDKIPVFIELRHLNQYPDNLETFIAEKTLKLQLKPSEDTFKRALKAGNFLFLFDGFDEIHSDKKQEIIRQIELFTDAYPQNNIVITTRQGSGIECFPKFYDFQVNNLTEEGITGFIKQMVEDEERQNRLLALTQESKYSHYFKNPLLLSMFIMAVEQHPEIPAKASAFYRNVFDTLYQKHDGITKNGFPRPKKTALQREDFEDILSKCSYLSYKEQRYSFTEEYLTDMLNKIKKEKYTYKTEDLIYDLQTNISILIKEGLELEFPHRSMQEYFAALFVSKLSKEKKKNTYISYTEKPILENLNFFMMCYQLDKYDFILYYYIPVLELIKQAIINNESNKLEYLLNFKEKHNIIAIIFVLIYQLANIDKKAPKDFMPDFIKEIDKKIQKLEQELARKEQEYDDFL